MKSGGSPDAARCMAPAARTSEHSDCVDGIACFGFLNRFHYGNFGDSALFGLET
jgi:hypothetical protein